jgi:L-threonylcarbamoyladenylate synthase
MRVRVVFGAEGEAEAVRLLAAGEPVGLPTETVYGLAAPALDPEACVRIFEIKERPFEDPLIVHVPGPEWMDKLAMAPRTASELAEAFWPGPLTLVVPRKNIVPDLVTAGQESVALRMSAHPAFSRIITAFGAPLAAPSANRFGKISSTRATHVAEELGDRIALIVDGGPCDHGLESTIVLLRDDSLHILREGPIGKSALARFGRIAPRPDDMVSPGSMKSHYAPSTPMDICSSPSAPDKSTGDRIGLLAWSSPRDGFAAVEILTPSGDPREAARNLYHAMRTLDAAGLDRIIAESPPHGPLADAIADRLRRAAAHR